MQEDPKPESLPEQQPQVDNTLYILMSITWAIFLCIIVVLILIGISEAVLSGLKITMCTSTICF